MFSISYTTGVNVQNTEHYDNPDRGVVERISPIFRVSCEMRRRRRRLGCCEVKSQSFNLSNRNLFTEANIRCLTPQRIRRSRLLGPQIVRLRRLGRMQGSEVSE